MRVSIHEEAVRKNVELFQQVLEQVKRERTRVRSKVYTAFLNRISGDILFEGDGTDFDELKSREWKLIRMRVRISEEEHLPVFEILEDGENSFQMSDLQPQACRIMSETIKVLNGISKRAGINADIDQVLDELRHLEIEAPRQKSTLKDIIHEAWHQVDRVGAEYLLQHQIPGTYLFRKDEYAAILEEQLQLRFGPSVKCFTLSHVSEKGKVSDHTVIKKREGWLFYDDDPSLEGKVYPTIEGLLKSMREELKIPLLH